MRQSFTDKRLHESSRSLILALNALIDEMKAEGFVLTLRQLYYAAVRRRIIANKETQYKRLGSVVNEARLVGLMDWDAIADPTRSLEALPTFSDPAAFLKFQADRYAEPLWAEQPYYAEVWIEKDSIAGVVERACSQYRVPYFVCRGFVSQQCLYEAGRRFSHYISQGKIVRVFYLGDRDEFGIELARDIEERIGFFTLAGRPQFDQIAIKPDQVSSLSIVSDPSSTTAWEIEAFPTMDLLRLVVSSIDGIVDRSAFLSAYQHEADAKRVIATLL